MKNPASKTKKTASAWDSVPKQRREPKIDHLAFVMLDPAICYAPGLFRDVGHGRPEAKVSHTAQYDFDIRGTDGVVVGENRVLFACEELLSGADVAVLQAAACGLAVTDEQLLINPTSAHPGIEESLLAKITVDEPLAPSNTLLYGTVSVQLILKAAGLPDNGRCISAAKASLDRLAKVKVSVCERDTGNILESYRLIAVAYPDKGPRVHVCMNPRLTAYLLGRMPHHIRVSLVEARQLGTDYPARTLHQRLSAVINDGEARPLKIGTLLEYLYPTDKAMTTSDEIRSGHTESYRKLASNPKKLLRSRIEVLGEKLLLLEKLKWALKNRTGEPDYLETLVEIKRAKSSRTKEDMNRIRAQQARMKHR